MESVRVCGGWAASGVAFVIATSVLAIGLIRVLDWMIDRDPDATLAEEFAEDASPDA